MSDPLQRDGSAQEPAQPQGRVSHRLRLGAKLKLTTHRHDVVDSTNERAFAALANGTAQHGDVHIARAQSAGRGRLGRSWESQAGEGLYLSLVLRPGPPMLSPVALTMLTGLALASAIRRLGVTSAHLDWPNDVVVGGAKLSGILVESRGLNPNAPAYVVGVGVNVAQREFSQELTNERAVTSLVLEGVEQREDSILTRAEELVLEELSHRLDGAHELSEKLGAEYLAETGLRDREVRIQIGAEHLTGKLVDLTLEDGLCLVDGAGKRSHHALEHVRSLAAL